MPSSQSPPPSSYSGFSLIELSVVLALIALVVGMSLSAGSMQLDMARFNGTNQKLETVRAALNLFQKKMGRYPCPAEPQLATSHANYGVEYNSGSCTAACPLGGLTCGTNAIIGMVPFKALGLPESLAYDSWEYRLTYAVDKSHTASSEYALGMLPIQDGAGNEITASPVLGKAIYVLLSHGMDRNGGNSPAGTLKTCGATAKDVENCDGDDTFMDALFNNGTVAAQYFDDLIAWQTQENYLPPEEEEEEESGLDVDYGENHLCIKKADGTAWCAGWNDTGQLGDGTGTDSWGTFVQVTNVSNVTQLSLAPHFTFLLQSDGTVICWGDDFGAGGCGDGPANDGQGNPVTATSLTQVSTYGYNHSCARKSDGTAWCWGENSNGQVGDNTTTSPRASAVQVLGTGAVGFLTGVTYVSVGMEHSCAVKDDGTAWCWGYNGDGQLGDNTTTQRKTPVQVLGTGAVGFLTGVVKIAATWDDTCALKSDGTVWCWGLNDTHQHGVGNATQHKTPVQAAPAQLTGIEQIEGGSYNHFCALKSDATMWCWGYNNFGETGDGGFWAGGYTDPPIQVLSDVADMGLGHSVSCAAKNDGTVWCWGKEQEIGTGNHTEVPQPITPLP